jgi:hypothetical protein
LLSVPYKVIQEKLLPNAVQERVLRILIGSAILNSGAHFDEEMYLRNNPDVASAIRRGEWKDGLSHFALQGYFEGRRDASQRFSEKWYLEQNRDVADAINRGEWSSAENHYLSVGMYELRAPSQNALQDLDRWRAALAIEVAPAQNALHDLDRRRDKLELAAVEPPSVQQRRGRPDRMATTDG